MRRFAAIALCVALVLAFASPASAVPSMVVQQVDTSAYPQVVFTVVTSPDAVPAPGDMPDVRVTENGHQLSDVTVSSMRAERSPIDVVLVMDTSGSMVGKPLADAVAAARNFAASMRPTDRIAVVSFSSEPVVIQGFTEDRTRLTAALSGLRASGETALYDGLVAAANLLKKATAQERYIVALSDGGDTLSINSANNAAIAVKAARAPVYAIALKSPEYNPGTLTAIARTSGGRMTLATDSNALAAIYASIAKEMQLRYRVKAVSLRPDTADLDYRLTLGSGTAAARTSARNPLFEASDASVAPALETPRPSGVSLVLAVILTFAAAAALVVAMYMFLRRDRAALEQLKFYDQLHEHDQAVRGAGDPTSVRAGLVDALGAIAERRGMTGLVQSWLDSAGLVWRANEYIFFHVVGTVLIALLVRLITGNFAVTALAVLLSVALPMLLLRVRASMRTHAFEDQLPDILDLIAGSLRSGWGMQQSIDLVVTETGEPARSEFKRTQSEVRLGLPLEEALARMADRVGSEDLRWTVSAIAIQREVGGNLAEVLNTVSHTIRERAELRRQVSALTAEGRFSLVVLTILPFALFGLLFLVNPGYILISLTTPLGLVAMAAGAMLLVIGIFWLNRVVRIEV